MIRMIRSGDHMFISPQVVIPLSLQKVSFFRES